MRSCVPGLPYQSWLEEGWAGPLHAGIQRKDVLGWNVHYNKARPDPERADRGIGGYALLLVQYQGGKTGLHQSGRRMRLWAVRPDL